ncbi:MAG TPA: hypothetical protein VNS34_03060 [Rhizobiaceae bacterium]|nr:hypothetical protein [Rhizobiaceae bacterium]
MSRDDSTDTRRPQRSGNAGEPSLPTDKARQGRWGGRVLIVLVVALILAAIAWWAVEIYGGAIKPQNPVDEAAPPSTRQDQAR